MGGKYQCFQRHVSNCFVNQMRNGNTLTQRIIVKQPRVTTVDGPQTFSFTKIKRKRGGKTAAQAHIKILSPPVDEVVTENEEKKTQTRGLRTISSKKLRKEKRKQRK